jgi:hypothetical protein
VLSASERVGEEAHGLALGASAYVQKPSDFTASFGGIQALVQHGLGAVGAPSQDRGAKEHLSDDSKSPGESYAHTRSLSCRQKKIRTAPG